MKERARRSVAFQRRLSVAAQYRTRRWRQLRRLFEAGGRESFVLGFRRATRIAVNGSRHLAAAVVSSTARRASN